MSVNQSPPLMLVLTRPVSVQGTVNMTMGLKDWFAGPGNALIIEGNPHIYQLIDGKWLPLNPASPPADPDDPNAVIGGL